MEHLTSSLIQDLYSALGGIQFLVKANAPDFTVVAATSDVYSHFSLHPSDVIGKPIIDAISSFSFESQIEAALYIVGKFTDCIITKEKCQVKQFRYDLPLLNGILREMYWDIQINPVLDEEGQVNYISYSAQEVTERVQLQKNYEISKRDNFAFETFKGSNFGVLILLGSEHKIAFANEAFYTLTDKTNSCIDRSISEIFPELDEQGYLNLLKDLYANGQAHMAHEAPLIVEMKGKLNRGYYDFVIKPYFTDSSKPHVGLLCMVRDVTENVVTRMNASFRRGSFEFSDEITDFGSFTIDLYSGKASFSKQINRWLELEDQVSFDELLPLFHRDDMLKITEEVSNFNQGKKENLDIVFRMIHPQSRQIHYLRAFVQTQERTENSAIISGVIQDISFKIKSEKALLNTANRLRSVIEASPFPIAIYSGNKFIFEYTNSSLLSFFGLTSDELGKPFKDVFAVYVKLGLQKKMEKVWNTDTPMQEKDVYIEFYRGEELVKAYINYDLTPLHDENGNIYGILHTTFDVTAVNVSKALIEENELRYRTFIEEAPMATALYLDSDFKVTYANSLMLEMWGKDTTVIGKSITDAIPGIHQYHYYEILNNVYVTGQIYTGNHIELTQPLRKDGSKMYVNFQYKPLMDKQGKIYGILNTAWDVTTQVMAQRLQEENHKNFRNMIMQAPIAIMILRGQDMLVDLMNPVMIELVNINPIKALDKPVENVFPVFKKRNWTKMLVDLFATGGSFISEEEEFAVRRNEEDILIYMRFNFEPMRDSNGVITGVMVVIHDITQQVLARKQIELAVSVRTEELASANAQLNIYNNQLKQFAYIASHDLQEPLRKISLFSQLLAGQLQNEVDGKVKHYLERIENSVHRMTNLIRDILGYSELTKDQLVYQRVDLNEVLQEVISEFDLQIAEKQAQIHYAQLPVIEGIRMQMVQLFNNLISNSLKYCPPQRKPQVSITSELVHQVTGLPLLREGYLHLTFKDNGIGFNQDYAEKIFVIFQRLHGKTQFEGTGIGLAMCRKITDNHHGLIQAHGQENTGATFEVYLPIRQQ